MTGGGAPVSRCELESVTLATGDGPDPLTALWIERADQAAAPRPRARSGFGAPPRRRPEAPAALGVAGRRRRPAARGGVGDRGRAGAASRRRPGWREAGEDLRKGTGGAASGERRSGGRRGFEGAGSGRGCSCQAETPPREVPPAPVATDRRLHRAVHASRREGAGRARWRGGRGLRRRLLRAGDVRQGHRWRRWRDRADRLRGLQRRGRPGGRCGRRRCRHGEGGQLRGEQDAAATAAAAVANAGLASRLARAVPPAWMEAVLARADQALAAGASGDGAATQAHRGRGPAGGGARRSAASPSSRWRWPSSRRAAEGPEAAPLPAQPRAGPDRALVPRRRGAAPPGGQRRGGRGEGRGGPGTAARRRPCA